MSQPERGAGHLKRNASSFGVMSSCVLKRGYALTDRRKGIVGRGNSIDKDMEA